MTDYLAPSAVRPTALALRDDTPETDEGRGSRASRAGVVAVAVLLGLAAASVGLKVAQIAGLPPFSFLILAAFVVALVVRRGDLLAVRRALVVGNRRTVEQEGAAPSLEGLLPTTVDAVFVLYLLVRFGVEVVDSGGLRGAELATVADLAVGYVALWAVRFTVRSRSDLRLFLLAFVTTSLPVSIIALMQIADVPGVNQLLIKTTKSVGLEQRVSSGSDLRATSTIGHWTNLGGYLLGIVSLGCLALMHARSWARSKLLLLVLVLAVLAQLSTLTFATVAVTALVLFVTAYRLRLLAIALGAMAVLTAIGGVLFGGLVLNRLSDQLSRKSSTGGFTELLPETLAYRVRIWEHQTLPAIAERPWAGWGNGLYLPGSTSPRPAYLQWMSPESEWFRIAVQAGIPALLVLLALLGVILHRFIGAAREDRRWSVLVWYLVGLIVISCIHSHLSDRGTPLILWVAVGVVLVHTAWPPPEPLPTRGRRAGGDGTARAAGAAEV